MPDITASTTVKVETPFTNDTIQQDSNFWRKYTTSRPSPPEALFHIIQDYRSRHAPGDPSTAIAHDVGTGPGNIAERLLRYYDHVVGSDIDKNTVAAATGLVPPNLANRLTFIAAPAEDLADDGVVAPNIGGDGNTDLVIVSECMPLLDAPRALAAFHNLLRPGGTLAIYFYGRPIFTSGPDPARLDALYDRIATRICRYFLPFKGTPSFPARLHGAETLASRLDNIALPSTEWEHVVRYKWNSDVPLMFQSQEAYDFDFGPVDRRGEGEVTRELRDRTWWQEEWDADRIEAFLKSVYPSYVDRAGSTYAEIERGFEELREALGGGKVTVSFPVVLILAAKK